MVHCCEHRNRGRDGRGGEPAIAWNQGVMMMAAATIGGYVGARGARRLPATWIRAVVIVTGVITSVVFFARS